MIQFYGYDKCSTCRRAQQWLDEHGVEYRKIDITQNPPPAELMRGAVTSGAYRQRELFNTSGKVYREMKLKDKLDGMNEREATELLVSNGRLVKRPIVTDGGERVTIGFDEKTYQEVWG